MKGEKTNIHVIILLVLGILAIGFKYSVKNETEIISNKIGQDGEIKNEVIFPEEKIVDNPDGTQSIIMISSEEKFTRSNIGEDKNIDIRNEIIFPEEKIVDNPDGTQSIIMVSSEEEFTGSNIGEDKNIDLRSETIFPEEKIVDNADGTQSIIQITGEE